MNRYPILDVCARIEGHKVQHNMLRNYCSDFDDWEDLLKQAQREGMTPLLRKHLVESESSYPASVRRILNILARRHLHQANVRIEMLQEILELYRRNKLTPIVLKGAALCHTLYPNPALRPMRDMDLLLNNDEIDLAQEILRNAGFRQSSSPIPDNHHHLPSLYKIAAGMTVCIELHRRLYPDCPPYYPQIHFEKLLAGSKRFNIDDTPVLTFNDEEMLHYLYQHAFRAPLTYESYKLINVADIIGFVEANYKTLDWEKIKEQYPVLYKPLPLLHHISPWDFNIIPEDFVPTKCRKRRLEPKPFTGWPQKRRRELKAEGRKLYRILCDTFWPPSWWLGIYYGATTKQRCLSCLLWRHPRHIFWWVKLYGLVLGEDHSLPSIENTHTFSFSKLAVCRVFRRVIGLSKKVK